MCDGDKLIVSCAALCERHQADSSSSAHINNLYNTCYWALIQQGEMKVQDAHEHLSVSLSLSLDQCSRH